MNKIFGSDIKINYFGEGADLCANKNGDLDVIEGEYNLGQAIINRIQTRKGEMKELGHPNYGSKLYEVIGEPNNEKTREMIKIYVKECVMQDPRVSEILKIVVSSHSEERNRVDINLTIIPIKSKNSINIVFPFYLEVA